MQQGIFLPESTASADSLTVLVQPPRAIACINICAYIKNPRHWQPTYCLDMQKYCTLSLTGMGRAALAAAVPYPGKVTQISHRRQISTKKTLKNKHKTTTQNSNGKHPKHVHSSHSLCRTTATSPTTQWNNICQLDEMLRDTHLFLDIGIGRFDHFLNFSCQISTHLRGTDRSHGAKC